MLDYSRRSANPVGRLVLRIAGYDDPRLDAWSDAICSALQLTNFWQDLKIDFERGRIYLPAEEIRGHGADEARPGRGAAHAGLAAAVAAAVARTRALFVAGRPLCDAVAGRLQARAARDVAGRHARARAHRARGFRRRGAPAVARRGRRAVAGVAARDLGGWLPPEP